MPLQPTVITRSDYKLIRYVPREGIAYTFRHEDVIIQETAVFGIVFELPSTRIGRQGLGQWHFGLPYQGRVGGLRHDLPSTVGAAQDQLQTDRPPSRRPTVELRVCTRNSTYTLGRSVPSPVNSDLETYSWSTPADQELLIEGTLSGGWPYTIRQAAPEVLIGTLWALVGTAYGIAVQASKQPRKRTR
jgi:hypothetical protein